VSGAAAAVADGSSRQRESAAEMAASVQQIAVSMREMAASATQAVVLSQGASGLAVEGESRIRAAAAQMESTARQVLRAADAICALERHGAAIRDISRLISDIARQTNLLSLNAAIEA